MHVIEAIGLVKAYGPVTAVDGLDLVVDEGELVAVLGPNGAGKTTTIEMVLGLRRPDAGRVRLFGAAPVQRDVRTRVGAMLQAGDAPPGLRVGELVALVSHYYPSTLPTSLLLARSDLSSLARVRVGDLSGGQRQRLSFALALAGDPDLLVLDEPTAALDVTARRAFWQRARELTDLGKTIVFSTHYLEEADQHADRVVMIDAGRVVRDGPPAQIKAQLSARAVHVRTDAPADWVERVDGVRSVRVETAADGARPPRLLVRTYQPERLITALLEAGHAVDDLTVVETDLETAFLSMTGNDRPSTDIGKDAA